MLGARVFSCVPLLAVLAFYIYIQSTTPQLMTLGGTLSEEELALELARWQDIKHVVEECVDGTYEQSQCNSTLDEVVHNRATGERWWFGHAHNDSGTSFEMYESMDRSGFVNVQHIHPLQDELVVVLEGAVYCQWQVKPLEWKECVLSPGDWMVIKAGTSHGLRNAANVPTIKERGDDVCDSGACDAVMRVRYTPGDDEEMAEFFRTLGRLSEKRGVMFWLPFAHGIPDPLHTALIWAHYPNLSRFWWMPHFIQRTWASVGSHIASFMGCTIE